MMGPLPRPLLGEGALNPLKELKELKGVIRELNGVKGHYLQTPATCQLVNRSSKLFAFAQQPVSTLN